MAIVYRFESDEMVRINGVTNIRYITLSTVTEFLLFAFCFLLFAFCFCKSEEFRKYTQEAKIRDESSVCVWYYQYPVYKYQLCQLRLWISSIFSFLTLSITFSLFDTTIPFIVVTQTSFFEQVRKVIIIIILNRLDGWLVGWL